MTSQKHGLSLEHCSKWWQWCSNFGFLWRWIHFTRKTYTFRGWDFREWLNLSKDFTSLNQKYTFLQWPPLRDWDWAFFSKIKKKIVYFHVQCTVHGSVNIGSGSCISASAIEDLQIISDNFFEKKNWFFKYHKFVV